MRYRSTRGEEVADSSTAILNGIAADGGLYVPSAFPAIDAGELAELAELEYKDRAAYVLSKFLTDFSFEELAEYAGKAYDKFEGGDPAPLIKVDDETYIMELWHGPTLAFKDLALTMLPYLMTGARKKYGIDKKTLILVATSGDTGKAALEGFKDVEGTEIVVFYPSEGVSAMQKLQMQTQEGGNVHVVGIEGNFDDAQNAVKSVFADADSRRRLDEAGYMLSSANSINFGRLAPQIAYYISAYVDLLSSEEIEEGEEVNFVVPSGNFGNVLAAFYAVKMGLPVKQLIVASNRNHVLTDFFSTGEYDANRDFHKTMSPSMDILISSNLERLIFELGGRDAEFVKNHMKDLAEMGRYEVDVDSLDEKFPEFLGYYSTEEETLDVIHNFFGEYGYLLDPHTAVAMSAYFKYLSESADADTPTVIVSTANPYKFPQDVYAAVAKAEETSAKKAIKKLYSFTGMDIPESLTELDNKPILHDTVIPKTGVKDTIMALFETKETING